MKLIDKFTLKSRSFYCRHKQQIDFHYNTLPPGIKRIIHQHFGNNSSCLPLPQLRKLNILPLDSAWAEAIIAPFHDPQISPSLPFTFGAICAQKTRINFAWCWTVLSWEGCPKYEDAACLNLQAGINLQRYDNLLICLAIPKTTSVRFAIKQNHEWGELTEQHLGTGRRDEISINLKEGSLDALKMFFKSNTSLNQTIKVSWVGLQNTILTNTIRNNKLEYAHNWPGLIIPQKKWDVIQFERGLLFSESDIDQLRKKKNFPGWHKHFKFLVSKAEEYLTRTPESDLNDYLPINDTRYLRNHEKGKEPYYFEALILGFVGIINNNKEMMLHAIRYLMCMIHTKHWTQSAESRLVGSTWDQRCFYEELATTSVSLLADWFSFALTRRAKDLVRQSIWDKGLAIIDRDLMKHEYLHHMNQGAVFCRARILGGLYIKNSWPRLGKYVDQAYSDMDKCLSGYIEKDGGVHEGIGYFCQTLQATLPAIIAYARAKGRPPDKYIKKRFPKCAGYVATMSASRPGEAMVDGDCRTNFFCGDSIPILANCFPNSVYGKILERCIATKSIFKVTGTLTNSGGILGFIYGPNEVEPSRPTVPTFSILPKSGHLASFRNNNKHSVLLHVSGSKAHPSHSHLDKGSFVMEVNRIPILIDRGMVNYYHSDELELRKSYMHNVLTPILDNGSYPDQALPSTAIIPHGRGDNTFVKAYIHLKNIWQEFMYKYSRYFISKDLYNISIIDKGELKSIGRLAFHLHSTSPFTIDGNNITIHKNNLTLQIDAPWAEYMLQRKESVDLKHEPVYHLMLHSYDIKSFNIETIIRIMP